MKIILKLSTIILVAGLVGCASKKKTNKNEIDFPEFMIEGHRGTRGLMPENTIQGMIKAVLDGANALELDLQFTADGKVVVAHDPYINRIYSLDPAGNEIPEEDAKKYIIYDMDYVDVRMFDVGSKDYPNYPRQGKLKTYIPELGEMIDSVEQFTTSNNMKPVIWNIEIKANLTSDNKYHPAPAELIRNVVEVLKSRGIDNRFYIQSFDARQIQEVRKSYPAIPVAYLTDDKSKTIAQHITAVGFQPEIFSPFHQIVTQSMIDEAHSLGMRIIPWTVNDESQMKSLMKMGVDGLITDFAGDLYHLRN